MNIITTVRLRIQTMSQGMIGRYHIIRKIGKGGMAQVYRAHDPVLRRDVALKVILDVFSDIPEFREGFRQEAETIAQLEHRAIVPVYDFGEDDDKLYLVMRLMPGESLRDRLNREKKISPAEASLILNRLTAALEEAHARGVIHRDIKPENVLLNREGLPFLSDFGIAHIVEETSVKNGRLNQPTGYVGSPAYMAPEQWLKDRPGSYTDVYQLGVMLFEVLTGQRPFRGTRQEALKEQHIKQAIPSARAINPDLPRDCDRVLETALAKNPYDRYNSSSEMAEALASALNPEMIANRYVLQEELRHGQRTVVYLALDKETEKTVALKIFNASLLSYPKFHRQFWDLTDCLQSLRYPSLVPILDAGIHHNKPYLIMPFVRGGSMRLRLEDEGRFSIDVVCQMLSQLAETVDAAAAEGIIHKDIKPSNILITQADEYLITDYGTVDIMELTEAVIHSNEVIGSYPYMAPEQWRFEAVNGRINVYQFGMLAYELLTGETPFRANSYEEWMERHLHTAVPDICIKVSDLPPTCDNIFQKALNKDGDNRYATVSQFINTLAQAYNSHTIEKLYKEGLTLYGQHDLEEAINRFEQVAAINPNYRDVNIYLTRANEEKRKASIYENGKNDHARQHWKEAIYWLDQITGYRDADVLLKEAKINLEKETLYQEGLAERDNGNSTSAYKTFKQLSRLDPNYKDVQILLQILESQQPATPRFPAKKAVIAILVVLIIIAIFFGRKPLFAVFSPTPAVSPPPAISLADCLATATITLQVTNKQYPSGQQFKDGDEISMMPDDTANLEALLISPKSGCDNIRESLLFNWDSLRQGTLPGDLNLQYQTTYTPEKVDAITVFVRADENDEPRKIVVAVRPSE